MPKGRREKRHQLYLTAHRRRMEKAQGPNPRSVLRDGSTVADEPLFRVYLTRREVEVLSQMLEEQVDLLSRYNRRQSPLSLKAEGRIKRKKALLASLPEG